MPTTTHPCLTCGACCAAYRVAFYWSEADASLGGHTPADMTVTLDPHRVAMMGTCVAPVRCVALRGTVGVGTQCAIYVQRPSPCRDLHAAWETDIPSPQCDRARQAHGLAPLAPHWNATTVNRYDVS